MSILGGFIAGIAGVVLFATSGYLISQTVFAPPLYTLIVLTSLVKVLGFVRAASRYGERLYSHRATFSLLSRLRVSYFSKLVPLVPGLLNRTRSGELLARIVGDIESLQFYFLRVAYPPIMVVMVFLATVIFTSAFSIWIALLLVLGMLLTAFVVPGIVLAGRSKIHARVRSQRAAFSAEAAELLYGFRDLKLYNQLTKRGDRLRQMSEELTDSQRREASGLLRGQSLHVFVTFLIYWGVLVLGSYLIMQGSLAGVFLAMLVMATNTVFEEAAPMAILPAYKQDSEYAARRLQQSIPPGQNLSSSEEVLGKMTPDAPSIELAGVSYQYKDEWRPVLSDISLELPAGSKTAIVGPSGSGKTTILELLLKLHIPTAGSISLNNNSVKALDEADIWRHTNVVLQQGHFFRGTVRENMLAGQEHCDDSALSVALQRAQLQGLELDAPVLEKGENLSDGEKQRLALARVMLRSGKLWLLDEPTSSLDYVTERLVLKQIFEQAAADTLIMISHRLAGLEVMDKIVVMDRGRVVEQGTYDELMNCKGYFYEMKQIELQLLAEIEAS